MVSRLYLVYNNFKEPYGTGAAILFVLLRAHATSRRLKYRNCCRFFGRDLIYYNQDINKSRKGQQPPLGRMHSCIPTQNRRARTIAVLRACLSATRYIAPCITVRIHVLLQQPELLRGRCCSNQFTFPSEAPKGRGFACRGTSCAELGTGVLAQDVLPV